MRTRALAVLVLVLAACGGKSDDPIVNLRQERDPGLRRATLKALAEKEGPGEFDLWDGLLRESDPEIPRLTAAALRQAADLPGWREPPRSLLDALLRAAARKEPEVRAEVLLAIGRVFAEDALVPPKLLPHLQDPEPRVRRAALEAFREFGPAAGGMDLGPLRALLKDPALSFDAALALASSGDAAPGAAGRLAAAVEDRTDPARAQQAGAALVVLGSRAVATAPRLAKALPGSPPGVARDLSDALGFSSSPDPSVPAALVRALGTRDEEVATAAALGLARLRKADAAAEKVLAGGVASGRPEVRRRACEGLLLLGKGGDAEWKALLDLAADPTSDGIRAADAVAALGRVAAAGRLPIGASIDVVTAAAGDPRLPVRRAALRAMAAITAR